MAGTINTDRSMPLIPISIIIESALVREGLRHILLANDLPVYNAVSNVHDLVIDRPDCHLIIVECFDAEACHHHVELDTVVRKFPHARIVVFSEELDTNCTLKHFASGVYGFIIKDTPIQCMVSIICLVQFGYRILPSQIIGAREGLLLSGPHDSSTAAEYGLLARETEVLDCVCRGMPNKAISRTLGISEPTVKLHIKNIFRKLSVSNRTQAAILASSMRRNRSGSAVYNGRSQALLHTDD